MKEIIYNGLGFPIILKVTKTKNFRGEILPDINHRELEDLVFKSLLFAKANLSGSQLAFVRGYMQKSQQDFASLLGLKSHATISGWENKNLAASGMPLATELVIRMLMADFIHEDGFSAKFKEYLLVKGTPEKLRLKVA